MEQRTSRYWTWPRHPHRPRLLVEDASGAMREAEFRSFEAAGFEVALCTGPDAERACPLVEHGECKLAEEADVVLFGLGATDEHGREVLRALRRRFPGTPVVVEVPREQRGQDLPRGCHALDFPASIEGQIRAVWEALEAARSRLPFLHRGPSPNPHVKNAS